MVTFLRKEFSDALVVEEEGLGFLQAVEAFDGMQALVVRGVSDLLTDKEEADAHGSQDVASSHAAAFALTVLAKLGPGTGGGWSVDPVVLPQLRSNYFVGRASIFDEIRNLFRSLPCKRVALTGIGGVGKTAAAVEFVAINRASYEAIAFVDAQSLGTLLRDYRRVAEAIGVDASDEPEAIVAGVSRWFEANKGWLLVLDNVDDSGFLERLLPATDEGHVLILTQRTSLDQLGCAHVALTPLSEPDGMAFLERRCQRGEASESDRQSLQRVTAQLEGLPLALEQAGAFMVETGMGFAQYASELERDRVAILTMGRPVTGDHAEGVQSTWLLSLREVQRTAPASSDLLRASAFLSSAAIPVRLLTDGGQHFGPAAHTMLSGKIEERGLNALEVIRPLRRYSLVHLNSTGDAIYVSALLQDVIRRSLAGGDQRHYARAVIRALASTFPDMGGFEQWGLCEALWPHALVAVERIEPQGMTIPEAGTLLLNVWRYAKSRNYEEVTESLGLDLLAFTRRVVGDGTQQHGAVLQNLSGVYNVQGRTEEAERVLREALAIWRRIQPGGEDEAISWQTLAQTLAHRKKYVEAEDAIRRSLALMAGKRGPANQAVWRTTLANIFVAQGKVTEAEAIFEECVRVLERAGRWFERDLAGTYVNLAHLIAVRGDGRTAEAYLLKARPLILGWFGADHLFMATWHSDAAIVHRAKGQLDIALVEAFKGLELQRRYSFSELPGYVARLKEHLAQCAELLRELKRDSEAADLEREAMGLSVRPGNKGAR